MTLEPGRAPWPSRAPDATSPAADAASRDADGRRKKRPRLAADARRRLARRYRWRRYLVAYLFLVPNLVFFVLFMLVPCVQVVLETFQKGGILGGLSWTGLTNWQKLPSNAIAVRSLSNTFGFAAMAVPGLIILGMVVGMMLVYVRRGGAAMRALLYFPTLAPVVVASLIWLFVVHPDFGAFNFALRLAGLQPLNWLGTRELAMPTIAALEVWRGIGFWGLFFLATFVALPQELYAAAHLDGASAWRRFVHLTLPLIRRPLLFALVIATIYCLQIFDAVFVLTDGSPAGATQTLVWYVYKALFQFDDVGLGATLSVLLLAVILVLTLLLMRLLRSRAAA
jgi:ABC-type sugar transport system permease subunit